MLLLFFFRLTHPLLMRMYVVSDPNAVQFNSVFIIDEMVDRNWNHNLGKNDTIRNKKRHFSTQLLQISLFKR